MRFCVWHCVQFAVFLSGCAIDPFADHKVSYNGYIYGDNFYGAVYGNRGCTGNGASLVYAINTCYPSPTVPGGSFLIASIEAIFYSDAACTQSVVRSPPPRLCPPPTHVAHGVGLTRTAAHSPQAVCATPLVSLHLQSST